MKVKVEYVLFRPFSLSVTLNIVNFNTSWQSPSNQLIPHLLPPHPQTLLDSNLTQRPLLSSPSTKSRRIHAHNHEKSKSTRQSTYTSLEPSYTPLVHHRTRTQTKRPQTKRTYPQQTVHINSNTARSRSVSMTRTQSQVTCFWRRAGTLIWLG